MSTPPFIGIVDLDQDGTPSGWRAIYCHWGGYPGEVGWLLQTFYDRADYGDPDRRRRRLPTGARSPNPAGRHAAG